MTSENDWGDENTKPREREIQTLFINVPFGNPDGDTLKVSEMELKRKSR